MTPAITRNKHGAKTVPALCAMCGASFAARDYEVRHGRGRHCSVKCSNRANLAKAQTSSRHFVPESERAARTRAAGLVNMRLRRGTMTKPTACQDCGKVARLDGHHDDYSKPDQVRWLCRSCHMKIHNPPIAQVA